MLKKFCYISVFFRQKLVASLEDRHLYSKTLERLRKFASDRAATEHDHVFRLLLYLFENGFIGEIGNALDAFDLGTHGTAAGIDHKIASRRSLPIHSHSSR